MVLCNTQLFQKLENGRSFGKRLFDRTYRSFDRIFISYCLLRYKARQAEEKIQWEIVVYEYFYGIILV